MPHTDDVSVMLGSARLAIMKRTFTPSVQACLLLARADRFSGWVLG
ncbi:hypothetical protein AtDm6_3569 [Acetobacter tropicalis]|uniref:Uncharacterized protein n=1 Tax=Acetobacter tropicalis TaxID=104102 RepID=A0A094YFK9_9PROT|nr:hypothetical protein AtDm6_3569 [Acetobacter tropicalis]